MKRDAMAQAGRRLVHRLDQLGEVTDEPDKLTRTFLSPAMRKANTLVGSWMREAGLAVRVDAVGNLIGRKESGRPAAKTLLLGSHLDTVRDAGRFDGALGVLLPLAALDCLRRQGVTLPFAVEVLGFSEEEGVRFSSSYLGSKGYVGRLGATDLKRRDAHGRTLSEALGRPPGSVPAHDRRELLGYVEAHIEQGPVLEARRLSLGVVSGIAGQTRAELTWTGRAGHAGTTPMALRRDALAGAAEFLLAAEAYARKRRPLVATVGRMAAAPGAANVIPGLAVHSLDVRHPRDAVRRRALADLRGAARKIARRRGLRLAWRTTQDDAAVACAPALTGLLERSVRAQQGRSLTLASGAGHDGVIISSLTPIAMLFVRCRAGLSHHPDEHVAPSDLAMALRVMVDFLQRLAAQYE